MLTDRYLGAERVTEHTLWLGPLDSDFCARSIKVCKSGDGVPLEASLNPFNCSFNL